MPRLPCIPFLSSHLDEWYGTGNGEAYPEKTPKSLSETSKSILHTYILMMNNTSSNKRIVKNSLLLYIRMFILVIISLYTSRIVLKTLGVEDFGINNVVGGVITFLGFLTGSLAGASSRFITFAIGKGNLKELKNIFNNIVLIHILFSIVVLIIGETIGLWFVTTQLNIPSGREHAAMWVYQLSILTSIGSLISSPYNAAIIAHEKMSAFAYLTLGDAILKLLAVFLLVYTPFDKLIFYAAYICLIQLFDFIIYIIYCNKKFEETKGLTFKNTDKHLFKEIFRYAGWTMNGSLAVFGYTQGLNILLNIFFNPVVNAARGIAVQVQNIVNNFCINFQMAINPQLTKSYAAGELKRMHELIIASSKYSFFLMLFICLPLAIEANTVLGWWLGEYPAHSVSFLRLILGASILYCFANPIITAVHATGRIKWFQIYEGTSLLLIVPVAYIALKFFNVPPESVFIIHIIIEIITQGIRLKIVLPMIGMDIKEYSRKVIFPVLKVALISPIVPIIAYHYIAVSKIMEFLILGITCVITVTLCTFYCGCSKKEKDFVISKIKNRI